jgi:iron complex transport system substrate-binding protein
VSPEKVIRSLFSILLILFATASTPVALARDVIDSAGRTVAVPDRVERVFAAGPPASILLYILAPDRLTGWPRALRPDERPYIAAPYRDLPETGRLTGRGSTVNLERLLESRPDLILDFGSVGQTYVSLAESVQRQTGIPYLLIDGHFDRTPGALRLLGEVLGVPARGERLAAWVEALFAEVDAARAAIPEAERPRVYLARGPAGLETGLKGSINTEIIERAGGRNVADPGDADVRRGIVTVSMEQVIVADPDTIVTWDPRFYESVWRNPLWAEIDAVQRGRIYLSPTTPFGWIDRPPSINRLMGLRWLSGLLMPQRIDFDLAAAVREFYALFYHVELDDAALSALLERAKGHP